MRWESGRRSSNLEDRRGSGGTGGRIAVGGGATLVIAVVVMLLGGDPMAVLGRMNGGSPDAVGEARAPSSPEEDSLKDFISVVLADTEDTWPALLQPLGVTYEQPRLVLFSNGVESACGFQQSAVGPFYCPGDSRVYLDLSFFAELARKYGAPGDFAQAYVVAHEIGHHVQNLLGTSAKVHAARARQSEAEANAVSVKLELQADCYAGVWANHAQAQRQMLEQGDVEEGLAAATAIGDDALQKKARGYVVPESFTHGSSAQRVEWFRKGLTQGTVQACETF